MIFRVQLLLQHQHGNNAHNLVLYAKWVPNASTYTITYKDEGNVTYTGSNLTSLPNSYVLGTGVTLVNGVRSGYTFDGWFDNSSCTGTAVTSISSTDTGDKTFYAKWTSQYNFVIENATDGITLTTSDVNSNTTINDLLNMSFNGINTTNTTISRIDVTLTYSSSTGSSQSANINLSYGQSNLTQQVSFQRNNTEVTASFTGLSILANQEFTITNTANKITNGNVQVTNKTIKVYFSTN